jgi:hypothetical protein
VNKRLAKPLLTQSECFSVVGPKTDIFFSDAAVIWSAFYTLRFNHNRHSMKARDIEADLNAICSVFGVQFTACFRTSEESAGYRAATLGEPQSQ